MGRSVERFWYSRPMVKVSSWLWSSPTSTSVIRGRNDSGMRSRTSTRVVAALYATTRIPIFFERSLIEPPWVPSLHGRTREAVVSGPLGQDGRPMPRRPRPPTTLDALVDHARASAQPPGDVLADVAVGLAGVHGRVDPATLPLARLGTNPEREPDRAVIAVLRAAPPDELVPDLLGQLHEGLLDAGHRRRNGVFYTPPA